MLPYVVKFADKVINPVGKVRRDHTLDLVIVVVLACLPSRLLNITKTTRASQAEVT